MAKEKPKRTEILAHDVPVGFGLTVQHLLATTQVLTVLEQMMAEEMQAKKEPLPETYLRVSSLMDVFDRVAKAATLHKIRSEGDDNEPT